MRLSSILSLGVAIVLGAAAAFLARGAIQGGSVAAVASSATAVVASEPLAFGVALTADNLREIQWPSNNVPDGAFSTITDLLKDGRRVTLAAIQRNEPILGPKITGPNQRATLSALIEDGMRAVTVRVDEVRGVAGFVLPGDRVDVILTVGESANSDPNSAAYADVLLQNAKVLGIDQQTNDRNEKPTVARAVTLELNIEQAQKVILAQGVGRLSLLLRQTGKADAQPARRVTAADLGRGEVIEKAPAENEKPVSSVAVTEVVHPTVHVIRNASKREQYTVAAER